MVTGSTENNGIFRVNVECLLSSGIKTHDRRLFSFIDLFPSYFIKLCQNIHPKTPLKCDFSIWAGPNTFTLWFANFQIKLAPLIRFTTLVLHFYFKIYSLKDISNFRYSNQKSITFFFILPWFKIFYECCLPLHCVTNAWPNYLLSEWVIVA